MESWPYLTCKGHGKVKWNLFKVLTFKKGWNLIPAAPVELKPSRLFWPRLVYLCESERPK